MKILFWIEKRRANKRGEAPLHLRITHHGKRVNVSTGIRLKPEQWDAQKQRMKGSTDLSQSVNQLLNTQRSKCLNSLGKLVAEGKAFSTQDVASLLKGEEKPEIGWLEMFDKHILHMESRVGVDYSSSTVRRYKSSRKNLRLFINDRLKKRDVHLSSIDRRMIADLDQYLRGELHLSNNYTIKCMEQIRKVFKKGSIEGYVSHNPFDLLSYRKTETEKEFLYADELKKLMEWQSEDLKLEKTKDIFLFMCYTGLAHSDAKKASVSDIRIDKDERPWLVLRRTKNNNLVQVPLLKPAITIIRKYEGTDCTKKGLLLPVPCNQVLNRNLKLLMKEVKIDRHISKHSARYSYASTVLLGNGVRIEVCQRLLAHSSVKSTMVYSKLSQQALITELDQLESNLP